MRRSFKFQMKPTAKQTTALTAMLLDHASLYNAALQERREAYAHPSKTSVTYGQQSDQLKHVRAEDLDGQGRWSLFTSQQQTLRRLNKAFTAFFDRIKKGQTPGYPRFRSPHRFDTVDFVEGDGARWNSVLMKRGGHRGKSVWAHVYFQGIGHVKVNQHRPVTGRVKTVSVKREGTRACPRWYVIISCDDVPTEPLDPTGVTIGLDLATGSNGLAYLSDGTVITNPRAFHRIQTRLAAVQREAADAKPKPFQRASRRHKRALDRARVLHAKAARVRADHLHKTVRTLVDTYDVIAVEDIRPANMTRRAKPKPDLDQPGEYLPNGASAKTGLNKSILDSGWTMFLELLDAKAECARRRVIRVNPAYTSQTCNACGNIDADARDRKVYTCTGCGWTGDADHNAAINIKRAGLALLHA